MKTPQHLSASTRHWFESVCKSYELEPHHLKLLTLAAEAWDRTQQARTIIDSEGITFLDRFDQPKARPEIGIERDSRLAFARLVRELDLDTEATPEASRPPQLHSIRR